MNIQGWMNVVQVNVWGGYRPIAVLRTSVVDHIVAGNCLEYQCRIVVSQYAAKQCC